MNKNAILALALAFVAGAFVMLVIRGGGTREPAPEPPVHADGADEHAGHTPEEHAAALAAEADEHAGHGSQSDPHASLAGGDHADHADQGEHAGHAGHADAPPRITWVPFPGGSALEGPRAAPSVGQDRAAWP